MRDICKDLFQALAPDVPGGEGLGFGQKGPCFSGSGFYSLGVGVCGFGFGFAV